MEVIGALAASAQLVVYVVKAAAFLSDLYEDLKNAPGRFQQHANHIKRLIEIILHIREKRFLHTAFVFAQLEDTISQAYHLHDLLMQVLDQSMDSSFRLKCSKVFKGKKKEKQILLAFQNLEREKTGLSLCLAAAQTELLRDGAKVHQCPPSPVSTPDSEQVRDNNIQSYSQYPPSPALINSDSEQVGNNNVQAYSQYLPSPAPANPDFEQAKNKEVQNMENLDTEMVDVGHQEKIANILGGISINVDEPTSSGQVHQNNGVYNPGSIVVKSIQVNKPKAGDTSIQNNGVVGVESFWTRK